MAQRIIHFLLHVPKCAGTTVEAHFRTHLGEAFCYAPRWENPLRNFIGNRYPGLKPEALAGIRAVSGHSLSISLKRQFPDAEIRESVLLRDPVGYLLSFYNYRWTRFEEGWGNEPPSFETWYRGQRRNPISRFLLNRYFEEGVPALYRLSSAGRLRLLEGYLASFHFVGSYRYADEMIGGISRELGIPDQVDHQNVTPRKKLSAGDLSGDMRRRIEADNALDQVLFDRWAERRWSGSPEGSAPRLSGADQGRYLLDDTVSGVLKKFIA